MAEASSLPPHTRRKSAEAAFFLAHMVAETQKPESEHNPEAFGYYLSAFLSAARSVTDVLQVEDQPGYRRIYQSWLNALPQQDKDLWATMSQFRRAEVHRKGIKVTPTTAFIPMREVRPGEFEPMVLNWQWLMEVQQGKRSAEGWGRVVLVPRFSVDGLPAEVIATCQRYMVLLSDLLGRWA